MSRLVLGCIGDDFSGSSDAASFIAAGGLNTILVDGVPKSDFIIPENCEAVVIALKIRSCSVNQAVSEALKAAEWLKAREIKHFYYKYCSTFDSTPEGNIGPVTDALMEFLHAPGTILCPALPANGRIVKDGLLYVKGIPLGESPMKDHPLNPMWDSRIKNLIEPQGKYKGIEIKRENLAKNTDKSVKDLQEEIGKDSRWYAIPEYETDDDADRIINAFGELQLLTGGSGILTALAKRFKATDVKLEDVSEQSCTLFGRTSGRGIIVAGSCSVATREQELFFMKNGSAVYQLRDEKVLSGEDNPAYIWEDINRRYGTEVAPLIFSYATPEELKLKRNGDGMKLARKIENILSDIVVTAVKNGVSRIIVAGGETSGAVTQKLGYKAFYIGESIAPGVPILIPIDNRKIRLVLKSGNFGQPDFFERALEMT